MKTTVKIENQIYEVGYPQCQGCEHLALPAPCVCLYPGEGCEYPESRKAGDD